MKPRVIHVNDAHLYENVEHIGRTTKWGNKYRIGVDGTRSEVVAKHKADVMADKSLQAAIRRELRGKNLSCFCKSASNPDRACHGDTLLAIANSNTLWGPK